MKSGAPNSYNHPMESSSRRQLRVYFLPSLVEPAALANSTAVVIDVLRATTTIVHALAAGAEAVIPCQEIATAREIAGSLPHGVLGGERLGLRIENFDLGNSPAEYNPATVQGKVVVMTTTNGTTALLHCRQAKRVLIAAFVNFSAVCDELSEADNVSILCAGTNQEITREDVLLAGAIASELARGSALSTQWNDQALLAMDAWRDMQVNLANCDLVDSLQQCLGGRNLIETGQGRDIAIAATIDKFHLVPEFDRRDGRIRLR